MCKRRHVRSKYWPFEQQLQLLLLQRPSILHRRLGNSSFLCSPKALAATLQRVHARHKQPLHKADEHAQHLEGLLPHLKPMALPLRVPWLRKFPAASTVRSTILNTLLLRMDTAALHTASNTCRAAVAAD